MGSTFFSLPLIPSVLDDVGNSMLPMKNKIWWENAQSGNSYSALFVLDCVADMYSCVIKLYDILFGSILLLL